MAIQAAMLHLAKKAVKLCQFNLELFSAEILPGQVPQGASENKSHSLMLFLSISHSPLHFLVLFFVMSPVKSRI